METSIQTLTNVKNKLANAKTLDDVLDIRDKAEAIRVYAHAAKLGLEIQNEAAEVKIRAERKAGEMLAVMPKNDGGDAKRKSLGNIVLPSEIPPTLSDIGIEKMQSSRWQTIASLPEKEFEQHIADVKTEGKELTSSGIIKVVKQEQRIVMHENKRERQIQDGKYAVIYADPPWQYENSGFDQSADAHYPTLPIDDICNMPFGSLADNGTVLFLWATNPLLPEAMRVIESWGFTYKTNIVWVKDRSVGMGWFLHSRHELLLIAVKENTPHPKIKPESVINAERTKHSKKPEIFYQIIESMYPGKKIELFSRNARPGWDTWGNEEY